jgi:hypothetical protein
MTDTHEAKSFRREGLRKHRISMTNQDAKLVLSGYRPNGADARDPFFEQALQQANRDPELTEWFEKQRAFDRVIVAKLRNIEPPTGLNSQIREGGNQRTIYTTHDATYDAKVRIDLPEGVLALSRRSGGYCVTGKGQPG